MAIKITSGDIFTPEQLEKHAKVYAGPGAGKTHFLVENIKNIVTTNPLITRSRARKVLCVTYTNAAVDEIKRRLDKFTDYIEVHTIHGFIIEHIIQPFQQDLRDIMKSDFGIEVSSKGKISSQVEGLGILHGVDKNEIYDFIRKTSHSELSDEEFKYSKKAMGEVEVNNDAFVSSITKGTPRCIELKVPSKINEQHVVPLKKYIWSEIRKLTHNEILYFGYRILESNPIALYAIRVKFPFIFVDEFQDTDATQIRTFANLARTIGTRLFVVGDVKQSIYAFKGATDQAFDILEREMKGTLRYYSLRNNYRTCSNIMKIMEKYFFAWSQEGLLRYEESVRPFKKDIGEVHMEMVYKKSEIPSQTMKVINQALQDLEMDVRSGKKKISEQTKVAVIVRGNRKAAEIANLCRANGKSVVLNSDKPFFCRKQFGIFMQ